MPKSLGTIALEHHGALVSGLSSWELLDQKPYSLNGLKTRQPLTQQADHPWLRPPIKTGRQRTVYKSLFNWYLNLVLSCGVRIASSIWVHYNSNQKERRNLQEFISLISASEFSGLKFLLGLTGLTSLAVLKTHSQVFSNTTVQKHQFFGAQPFLWSNCHIHNYWKNHSFD